MKLYMHPASTTCRPIMLFAAENNISLETEIVDLMTGEQTRPEYAAINPNCLVPCLSEDDFRLSESSAILKYLADRFDTPDYPRDLQARARVNERMDWFNANFYKDFGYNLVYPQLFPHHRRASEAGQQATLEWGQTRTRHWLAILDGHMLDGQPFLCGKDLTIADYFGACLIELGVAIRYEFTSYRNIETWLTRMRELGSWNDVHKVFYAFAESLASRQFKAA